MMPTSYKLPGKAATTTNSKTVTERYNKQAKLDMKTQAIQESMRVREFKVNKELMQRAKSAVGARKL